MSSNFSPIESALATVEDSETYDRWFRAKAQASLADQRPPIPHDEVMAKLREIIEAKCDVQASSPIAALKRK
ncbi:stability determinant [Janthinobacterium sp.]|uniref:type II toxin-antitoxin system RelB family antitoxin n=1 Tax=Janthinobacterium sp. TaxID=1871054 RepID=UPI00293D2A9A|nr:stability determinant [Janthinobacterium sp.]